MIHAFHLKSILVNIYRLDTNGYHASWKIRWHRDRPAYRKYTYHLPTSNANDTTFQRAIKTKPYGFIAKPFQLEQLTRGLEIAFNHIDDLNTNEENSHDQITTSSDYLFVRQKKLMVKILIKDILFVKAERNYCVVNTEESKFLASVPMKNIQDHLPNKKFVKIHRSYLVNIDKIDAIGEYKEMRIIHNNSIPISRRNKGDLMKRLRSF